MSSSFAHQKCCMTWKDFPKTLCRYNTTTIRMLTKWSCDSQDKDMWEMVMDGLTCLVVQAVIITDWLLGNNAFSQTPILFLNLCSRQLRSELQNCIECTIATNLFKRSLFVTRNLLNSLLKILIWQHWRYPHKAWCCQLLSTLDLTLHITKHLVGLVQQITPSYPYY